METASNIEVSSTKRFTDFALAPDVLESLAKSGLERPTPIQECCLGPILEGKDVVGKAETGTGKTIGFGAPLVGKIDTHRVAVQALVLTPTRELAQQVAGVIEELGKGRNLGVVVVVGGIHASEQVLKLRSGSQVVVGTPGRVLEFLQDRTLSLVYCETVVLDEADRMLDMGFIDDVTRILDKTPPERQTLLFSATIPPEIDTILHRYMREPLSFSTSHGLATVAEIRQQYVESDFPRKFKTLQGILDARAGESILIFCNTRRQAIDLDRMLWGHGYCAGALHGEHDQAVRFRVLEAFRTGEIKILVATDVASRGLDIDDIACVVNYEIPDDPETYVHRIGRTGRAQKTGTAVSIVSGKEWNYWQRILKVMKFPVERLGPERVQRSDYRQGSRDRFDGQDRRTDSRDRHSRSGGGRRDPRRDAPHGSSRSVARPAGAVPHGAGLPGAVPHGAGLPGAVPHGAGGGGAQGAAGSAAEGGSEGSVRSGAEASHGAARRGAGGEIVRRDRRERHEDVAREGSTMANAGQEYPAGDAELSSAGSRGDEEAAFTAGNTEAFFEGGAAEVARDDETAGGSVPGGGPPQGAHSPVGGAGVEDEEDSAVETGSQGGEGPGDAGARRGGQGEEGRPGRRSRRRRRRGRGGDEPNGAQRGAHGGGTPGAALPGGTKDVGSYRPPVRSSEPLPRPETKGPAEGSLPKEPEPLTGRPDVWDRPKQERPARIKLEELDDDFVKTDYFSVDHSLIDRGRPVHPRERHREGGGPGASSEGRRAHPEGHPARAEGHRAQPGGHPARAGGHRGPAAEGRAKEEPHGGRKPPVQGERGHHGERGPHPAHGRSEGTGHGEPHGGGGGAGDGRRRRRRHRRSGKRSGPGEGSPPAEGS